MARRISDRLPWLGLNAPATLPTASSVWTIAKRWFPRSTDSSFITRPNTQEGRDSSAPVPSRLSCLATGPGGCLSTACSAAMEVVRSAVLDVLKIGFKKRKGPVSSTELGRHCRTENALLTAQITSVLPRFNHDQMRSAVPATEVTKVCLRLRHLVQECVPCEMEESRVTTPHSRIITQQVIKAAKEAGGLEYRGCVVSGFPNIPSIRNGR